MDKPALGIPNKKVSEFGKTVHRAFVGEEQATISNHLFVGKRERERVQ